MTRNGPNRSVKPKKGTKKGGSIWPANLSLGFFNKNNKKKNKRLPVKQKSPIPASKRPPTLNNNSIKVTLRNNRKCTPRIFYIPDRICKLLPWELLKCFFLQPHRVADLDNKLVENLVGNPKRLNPPSSSSTINLSSNQFTSSFPNQQQNILQNINPTQTSPTNNNGFSVDPAFNPFNSKGSRGNGADFFPPQNGFNIR